ncbi:hypothetical protein U9M48_018607 [Paspalum notatum var. saurae]|uniref:Uncharacterized protein n=1 Tax=Paspalum notatum var. saurae TaxID=547442 RepID=A0AAQ3WQN9_PASNO
MYLAPSIPSIKVKVGSVSASPPHRACWSFAVIRTSGDPRQAHPETCSTSTVATTADATQDAGSVHSSLLAATKACEVRCSSYIVRAPAASGAEAS